GYHNDDQTHHNSLKPGTYYIKTYAYDGYGSYSVTSVFTPARYTENEEPNDARETAASVPVQTGETGHLGYYARGITDTHDWYSFTVPAGWDTLFVRIMSDSTLEADANLHDANGNQIAHDGRSGIESGFYLPKPAAGKYSLDYYRYSGYGAYAYIVTNHWQADVTISEGQDQILPPTHVIAADVPNDNGHSLRLSWTLSVSEKDGSVLRYRIFRSRSSVLTAPVPLSRFASVDSLNSWDLHYTVLIDSVSAGTSEYLDTIPLNGTPYYYWIQAVGTTGVGKPVPAEFITAVAETPRKFRVSPPYPNPFNPAATISYELPEQAQVRLVVYDSLGRKVRVLENAVMDAGAHQAVWNGRNASGEAAASGIYLYRIEAGSFRAQGKMTLLR
ncbi:MAG: FlgD immunoglobulin-like domain containing protein, partial [Candidatus Latescibacterota bacterium]